MTHDWQLIWQPAGKCAGKFQSHLMLLKERNPAVRFCFPVTNPLGQHPLNWINMMRLSPTSWLVERLPGEPDATVWLFDPWPTPPTHTHTTASPRSAPVQWIRFLKDKKEGTDPRLWAISVGKHKHFLCHALSISCLAGFSEQVISVIQSLHRRSCPSWNGIATNTH